MMSRGASPLKHMLLSLYCCNFNYSSACCEVNIRICVGELQERNNTDLLQSYSVKSMAFKLAPTLV